MQAVLPRARIKRTVACSQFGTTEEDHDPSVSAHTRHRRGQLRVQLLHVSPRPPPGQKKKKQDLQIYSACIPCGNQHLSAEFIITILHILLFLVRTLITKVEIIYYHLKYVVPPGQCLAVNSLVEFGRNQ